MNKYTLYRWAVIVCQPLLRLYLKIRIRIGKEDSARTDERFGIASMVRPRGQLIWFHAASVGESQSILPLVDAILQQSGANVLITTGTRTSAEFLRPKMNVRVIHQFVPLDHPQWVDRFLHHWQPDLGIWVESELWPNLLVQAKQTGIPLVLLNARMSDRSFATWQKSPGLIRHLLSCFSIILAQNETYAGYFRALGAPQVEMTGNIKFASSPLAYDPQQLQILQSQIGARPVWIAASTHDGEEIAAAQAHKILQKEFPNLLTIIAPRHPQRAMKIVSQLRGMGLRLAQRTASQKILSETQIYLADTIGELGLFFASCKIVFMGNSLKTQGGHNLLEPARFHCAVIHGIEMQNFLDLQKAFLEAQASIQIADERQLQQALRELLFNPSLAQQMGERAYAVAQGQDQVLNTVWAYLQRYIQSDIPSEQKYYANA